MAASRPAASRSAVAVLALAYTLGVMGTLWDWHDHMVGPGTMPPHVVIDVGGVVVLGVLAFSGRAAPRSTSFAALYGLLALVVLALLGPLVLMVAAPRSALMAVVMRSMMSSGALLALVPLVLLAGWGAWRWLSLAPLSTWRLGVALAIVVVALATVWDLYWHQTHPMEVRASMASLPPHQAVLAGFLIGLVGAAYGVVSRRGPSKRRHQAETA